MSDYFEQEEVLRSYDATLMRRMLRYLRPYRALFVLSVLALLLSTAGELLLPAILRRATDAHILPSSRARRRQALDQPSRAALQPGLDPDLAFGDLHLLPAGGLSGLSGRDKARLREEGSLLSDN